MQRLELQIAYEAGSETNDAIFLLYSRLVEMKYFPRIKDISTLKTRVNGELFPLYIFSS